MIPDVSTYTQQAVTVKANVVTSGIAALLQKPAADVNEEELARVLAPMLATQVRVLSDEDLVRVATAVANEEDYRERKRLS